MFFFTYRSIRHNFDQDGIFSWLGSGVRYRSPPCIGCVASPVSVTWSSYLATVRDLRILQVETQRDSTVLKVGHAAVARRIARPRLGLTPQHEVVAAAHTPSGLGFGGLQAEDGGAGSVAARATTAEPRLKLSVLLDPAFDSELACLPQARVREMFTSHVKLRGAEPSDFGSSQRPQTGHHGRFGALCRFLTCSVRMAKNCSTSSLTLIGPSCPTAPGSGRNCLDRPPLCVGGPLSGSTAQRSCCWTWHLLRSWTTSEGWSGACHSCTTTLGSSFTTLTCGCVPSHSSGCAGEPIGIRQHVERRPRGNSVRDGADKEWWAENLRRPAIVHLACTKSAGTAVEKGAQRRPNCPRGQRGPGSLTRITQASTEVPGILWVSLCPQRKINVRRVQQYARLPATCLRVP